MEPQSSQSHVERTTALGWVSSTAQMVLGNP
jgi:hypothetical protein